MSLTETVAHVDRRPSHSSLIIQTRLNRDSNGYTDGNREHDQVELGELSGGSTKAADSPPSTVFPASSPKTRRIANIQFAALCWALFIAGWNDGTTGPLLPRIMTVYKVGFAVVSLLFVFTCIGCMIGAMVNVYLNDRYGFGTAVVVGAVGQLVGYTICAPAPPFPVLVLGYAINGFGLALQDASANGFVASLKENAATKMGIMHAIYGLGAFAAPLVSTQFARMPRWSFHFLVSVGMALCDIVVLIAVFRFKTQDECLKEIGQPPVEVSTSSPENGNLYKQIFKLKALHLVGIFILTYVGVEVTVGGWIVKYVNDVRGGGPSSGYISSGFFGGLTLGRVAFLWVNKVVGERRVIFLYVLTAIVLELIIWLVPSLVGGAVAVAFVGMALGPVYPVVMNHCGRILPPRLLTGCIGCITGFGVAGGALVPFITGALASSKGIQSLQPLLVAMMALMFIIWIFVPSSPRRDD